MVRSISCGHCGQTHPTVAAVRACSVVTTPTVQPPPSSAQPRPTPSASSPSPTPVQPPPTSSASSTGSVPEAGLGLSAEELAGPFELGRSIVVGPGDDIPDPWRGSVELAVSAEADPETVDRLRQGWQNRERLVLRWSGPAPDPDPVVNLPFYRWEADLDIPGDDIEFFATANAVWAVGDRPSFAPLERALALGAGAADPGAGGDVVGRDGTPAWVDGGPLNLVPDHNRGEPDGIGIIPRCQLIARSLNPLRFEPSCRAALAPDQLAAVTHASGPARILAPAGSGKTRVLTERTRHLTVDRGLSPAAISLVAYNRRARQEMQDRLRDIGGLDIRTLNSLALAIATGRGPFATGPTRPLATIDEPAARRLLSDLIPGRRRQRLTDPLEPWIDALSACRLGLREPEEIEAAYGGDITGFPQVLAAYRQALADRGAMDFDEQILVAIDRLLTDPEARRRARGAVPVLLIDEFQDLTPAHLLLVRLLAGPAREVFAVGDDDQTIYGYAGASPRWLVRFNHYFPLAGDHRLTVNYRCPPGVVTEAANLLSHNRDRVPKTILAGRSLPQPGREPPGWEPATVATVGDPQLALVERVQSLLKDGIAPGDIAVLSRVNAALLPAAVHLKMSGVDSNRPPGIDSRMLERSGFAAALAWLRLAVAPSQRLDGTDLGLALRRPPRSLHPRVSEWVCEQESVARLKALANRLNTEREAQAVGGFADDLERVRMEARNGTTESVLDMVLNSIGLLGAASQLDSSQRSARRAAHADDLAALVAIAPLQPEITEFEPWLRQVLATLDDDEPMTESDPAARIMLATVHTTKGMEWPHVIVHNVRDGLFPHRLATNIEEERRVFHVAMTRGSESVTITASGPPSPFMAERLQARPDSEAWPDEAPRSAGNGRSATPAPATGTKKASAPGAVTATSNRSEDNPPATEAEAARREALTLWRRQRCKDDGVPAYVVLDNKTLFAIAASNPADLGALGAISGIGPTKLDRYGADILGVLSATGDSVDDL